MLLRGLMIHEEKGLPLQSATIYWASLRDAVEWKMDQDSTNRIVLLLLAPQLPTRPTGPCIKSDPLSKNTQMRGWGRRRPELGCP